jgi:hypothetical protein
MLPGGTATSWDEGSVLWGVLPILVGGSTKPTRTAVALLPRRLKTRPKLQAGINRAPKLVDLWGK